MMLIMVSMAVEAQVKVLFGENGDDKFKSDGDKIEVTYDGGTIVVTQKAVDANNVTVYLAVTPNKGYTMQEKDVIEAYAVVPADINPTRALTVSEKLTLECDDFKDDTSSRTYHATIDSNLALWVKKAEFMKEGDNGSKSTITGDQDDYSGTYYIASRDYVEANTTTNYYLCPTEEWAYYQSSSPYYYVYSSGCETDKPFMTTYQCRNGVYSAQNAVWIIDKQSNGYYHIKRAIDGKYLTRNRKMGESSNAGRMRVHLESSPADDDDALFEINWNEDYSCYDIITKKNDGDSGDDLKRKYLNVTGAKGGNGNIQELQGTSARNDGPTNNKNVGGIIGLWTATGDPNGKWYLEEVVEKPVISQAANGDVSITCATSNTTIYYTFDGSDPVVPADGAAAPTGPTYKYTAAFTPELGSTGVKAVAVLSDLHAAVSKKAERSFVAYSTPNFSFDGVDKVTISAAHADATIYCTTNGDDPTVDPSLIYDGTPLTVSGTSTVKAIATHTGFITSDIATFTITQVETPTIQDNGSNAISITSETPDATIYYTTDGSIPTTSSLLYTTPLWENVSGVTIKAIAVKENMLPSEVVSGSVTLQCATPVIKRVGLTFTLSCSMPTDATFYYSINGGSETSYSGPVTFTRDQLPITVTAVAQHSNYTDSETASMVLKNGTGTSDDPYLIYDTTDFTNFVTNVNNGSTASACYELGADVSANGMDAITTEFTGTFDGGGYTISNLGNALFNSVNGGIVKNVILDAVSVSGGTNVGAIANKVTGTSSKIASIYNCGVLSGSVSGSGYVGSIVGQLGDSDDDKCYARVINCFSYATVSGGSEAGGIVGYNDYATTAADIRTMVMNCMFYGDIESGTNVSPVFGGDNIANLQGGLNTFNYYAYGKSTTFNARTEDATKKYNSALAVEDKYLNRFEFYRLLLNSNKKLAAFYATGSPDNADQKMMKWVLETADRTNDTPKPYPVLKAQGYYPSIINPDFENAPDSASVGRNHGGKLGKTLSVTISSVGSNAPSGARITNGSLTLQRTDKDFDRFNFNYDKVQLPYYNDVGTGNYTGNRVVTGWKITAITPVNNDPYTSSNYPATGVRDFPDHNYADRHSSNKDLYSVSGRVFSQGAYFDVPYGVRSITIEPYWGKAYYIADPNYDVVYNNDYSVKENVTQTGTQVSLVDPKTQFHGQSVETSITRSLDAIAASTSDQGLGGLGPTVYDNALVLVGNLHLNTVPLNGDRPFTMMSVDEDNDHEPDYSLIYHHINRSNITPIRFDFLTVPGTAQAQKPNGASLICNFTIFKTRGWFEVTNTAFMYSSQIEYENSDLGTGVTKIDAPLILLGGVFDQFVSTQKTAVSGKTTYIHVGGNVWINSFGMGTHSDGSESTPHVPVSVTGGEYEEFYLTGTYNANATVRDDNAECYISGGRFGEVAAAAQEQIGDDDTTNGNVHWQIYDADITSFFGGGVNDAKPVKGNITTDIFNSHVDLFCGGPKFGNMASGKKVTTTAEGCVFGQYFGGGYGGNSYSRKKYRDHSNYDFQSWQNYYYKDDGSGDKGKYYDGATTQSSQQGGQTDYGKKGPGVGVDFDYEFFVWSSGQTGGRFFVKFVSFSLAQCNDVNSTLTNCVVDENFYGGGNLGKVTGTATSILDGCTVKGNAFGAGFSATLPTIPVRDAGFKKVGSNYLIPKFNQSSGMFEPGTPSGTTDYTWEKVAAYPSSEGGAGFDGTQVITTQNIEKNNLGTVANVSLTLKGTTTIGTVGDINTGNVYGGGDESAVTGNATVTLQGNTQVLGNVYGGGNKGSVSGSTEVNIE